MLRACVWWVIGDGEWVLGDGEWVLGDGEWVLRAYV